MQSPSITFRSMKQPIDKWLENLPFQELWKLYYGFIGDNYEKFKKYAEKIRKDSIPS